MIEFSLAEDSMPFNFFKEIGFSFEELAIDCIKTKFDTLSHSECEIIFQDNYDLFSEKIYELRGCLWSQQNLFDVFGFFFKQLPVIFLFYFTSE